MTQGMVFLAVYNSFSLLIMAQRVIQFFFKCGLRIGKITSVACALDGIHLCAKCLDFSGI